MADNRLISALRLSGILSFGPEETAIDLEPLNVLIGPNATGKSNFIHAVGLLKAAATDLDKAIHDGGGIDEWLWKGQGRTGVATIGVNPPYIGGIRYELSLVKALLSLGVDIASERIWIKRKGSRSTAYWETLYEYRRDKRAATAVRTDWDSQSRETTELTAPHFDSDKSILVQLRESIAYPEIFLLSDEFMGIRSYGSFDTGRFSEIRRPQTPGMPGSLMESGANLSTVLNSMESSPKAKDEIVGRLREFYPRIKDIRTVVTGSFIHTAFHEDGLDAPIPAMRMSDGSLQYLCLLAILCQPELPPLICLEEPEKGLHPDIIPEIAKLLRETSERTQLVVTTHSDILVDALSDTPESVIVTERGDNGTELRRLDKDDLKDWLEKYSLGELWSRGHIGGNRW